MASLSLILPSTLAVSLTASRLIACTLMAAAILASACSSQYPRRDPTGERFPSIRGQTLAEEPVRLPDDVLGGAVLLFIGYEQVIDSTYVLLTNFP